MNQNLVIIENSILSSVLRLFFNLLYHRFSWAYDSFANFVSLGNWKKWITAILPYIHGEKVLELGFGTGILQNSLSESQIRCFGIDISKQMCKIAKNRMKGNFYEQQLANANAESLPFPKNTFDQVVSTFPSDFIIKINTLSEITRVLIPGGQLVIIPYAWIKGERWFERLAAWVFRITNQAPDEEIKGIAPTELLGFNLNLERLNLKNSSLRVILATKKDCEITKNFLNG